MHVVAGTLSVSFTARVGGRVNDAENLAVLRGYISDGPAWLIGAGVHLRIRELCPGRWHALLEGNPRGHAALEVVDTAYTVDKPGRRRLGKLEAQSGRGRRVVY